MSLMPTILWTIAALLLIALALIGLYRATQRTPLPALPQKSWFTLWAWIGPPVLGILCLIALPFIIGEAGDFFMMIFAGLASLCILLSALGGLILGIWALLRQERFCKAAWGPIILSVIVIVNMVLLIGGSPDPGYSTLEVADLKYMSQMRAPHFFETKRELTDDERTFLRFVLLQFKPEFSDQVDGLTVVGQCSCRVCPTLHFQPHFQDQEEVLNLLGMDESGIPIGIVLYTYDGRLSELEFWSPTGEHLETYPTFQSLETISP